MKNTIRVNEIFGPTIQGEGPDLGRPCLFVRLQGCPVQCPGCDTAFTWNGTEPGRGMTLEELDGDVRHRIKAAPNSGLIISGGEPMIHYRNTGLAEVLHGWKFMVPWIGLETSGFVGSHRIADTDFHYLNHFLDSFTTIVFSPKVTPCLRGPRWSYDQVQVNFPYLFKFAMMGGKGISFAVKYVVRDAEDVAAVLDFRRRWEASMKHAEAKEYVMPYGITAEEVVAGCHYLAKVVAERPGLILSPRLHSIMWGPKRGV